MGPPGEPSWDVVGAPSWALSPCHDADPGSAFGRHPCCGSLPSEEEEEAFPQQQPRLHGPGAGVLPAMRCASDSVCDGGPHRWAWGALAPLLDGVTQTPPIT